MEDNELVFILQKKEKESKTYLFATKIMMAMGVLVSTVWAIVVYARTGDKTLMWSVFTFVLCFSLLFFSVVAFMLYRFKLGKYNQDAKEKMKTIEKAIVTDKKYMHLNDTYHFYTDSEIKFSIEVGGNDFDKLLVGDEINLEYATFSKEYFGYF